MRDSLPCFDAWREAQCRPRTLSSPKCGPAILAPTNRSRLGPTRIGRRNCEPIPPMRFSRLVIPAQHVTSLTWCGDMLVDWTNGGVVYHIDGRRSDSQVHWAYMFDAASPSLVLQASR